jgi:excinuclease ABC subunit C
MKETPKERLLARVRDFPDTPGIYLMRGSSGEILYVGKANALRKRVLSYFRRPVGYRTWAMLSQVGDIEIMKLRSEEEALLLECKFIKEFQPKYNVSLRDDKRYPMVRMGLDETYPKFTVVRIKKNDNARYFGPFTDATALKRTLKFLRKLFKIRSCNYREPGPREAKHCIYYHIKTCMAPCVQEASRHQYMEAMKDACLMLEGHHKGLVLDLKKRMKVASARMEFEKAATLRDHIKALKAVVGSRPRNIRWYARTASQLDEGVRNLREVLHLNSLPNVIEAFDISNIAGNQAVGSMVRFVGGRPANKDYRKFKIREVSGINDYKMMQEVVRRRYTRLVTEGRPLPDLILIDGGKGHLGAVQQSMIEMGLEAIPMISLAKRQEEIFIPGRSYPLLLPSDSPARYLVQRVRDEAHRFAIGYHKALRAKRIRASVLDDIPGIGGKKKTLLLKRFSSVGKTRSLPQDELAAVPGIGHTLARDILKSLQK